MQLIMLQLSDLPTDQILQRFAQRYPEADVTAVASFLMLLRVATDLSLALDACLSKHDLVQGRWWVLILLMREQDLTSQPSVLAEKLGVTRATMTGLLDGLEQGGLVQRVSSPQDRRSIQVKLTAAGQAKLDAVMPDYYSRLRLCMQGLSEDQRSDLQNILGVIDRGLSAWDFHH